MIWDTRNSTYTFTGKILTQTQDLQTLEISKASRIPSSQKINNNADNKNNSSDS